MARRSLGRQFKWLWGAYAVSAYGTGIGFGAFSIIAIRVLHAGPAQVSALPAAGLAAGGLAAVPLGPWVERHRRLPVMITMDLARFAALATIPAAFALGWLSLAQLLVVSVIVAASKIAFGAASGAYLKALVPPGDLLTASGRFESTTWSATMLGPPLGGAAIGVLGPVATVLADAFSYLLSAAGIAAIGGARPEPVPEPRPVPEPQPVPELEPVPEPRPVPEQGPAGRPRREGAASPLAGGLGAGWRHIWHHPVLRLLLVNAVLVNGLILATEPILAVLMLGRLGFAPWQFGLAFAAPCAGGLAGSRLARPVAARLGQQRVLLAAGTLRACWPVGLAFIRPGAAGIVLVIVIQLGLVTSMGVFNPVLAACRLEQTGRDRIARTLSAWSVTSSLTIAALTALWGVLASLTSPRIAIAAAGVLLLATPLALPRRAAMPRPAPEPQPGLAGGT